MIRERSDRVTKAESHEQTRSWEIKNVEICVNAEVSHACYLKACHGFEQSVKGFRRTCLDF